MFGPQSVTDRRSTLLATVVLSTVAAGGSYLQWRLEIRLFLGWGEQGDHGPSPAERARVLGATTGTKGSGDAKP